MNIEKPTLTSVQARWRQYYLNQLPQKPFCCLPAYLHLFRRKWREEKAALLDKMDSEEKSEIQEWREQAKKELNDWYERRDEQLGKTQTSNRYVCASVCHRNLFCWPKWKRFDNQLGKLQCNFLDAAIWKKIDQSNVYWRNSMEVVNIS